MTVIPVSNTAPSIARFQALGCPCEVLIDAENKAAESYFIDIAMKEALRIEKKYSRYVKGNIIDRINSSNGQAIAVDAETAALLHYAAACYEVSDGLFDITTGVLRKVWPHFNGSETVVQPQALTEVLKTMGWNKVRWAHDSIQMPTGFEIDFGGIGKEYAADRILNLLIKEGARSVLVNLGGDIAAQGDRLWKVGIEDVQHSGKVAKVVSLHTGGLATSGMTKRFTHVHEQRKGHILNPKTGWPVEEAPLSVTVMAKTCTEAGLWSSLAMLQGAQAEHYLAAHALEFWCYR